MLYQEPIYGNSWFFSSNKLSKNTPAYEQRLLGLPGAQIKAELLSFIEQMGIRKDIIILEKEEDSLGSWKGTNSYTEGDAVIYVHPEFYKTDKEACLGYVKIAMMHIKNDEDARLPLITAISSMAYSSIFTFLAVPLPLVATLITTTITFFILKEFFKYTVLKLVYDKEMANTFQESIKYDTLRNFLKCRNNTNVLDALGESSVEKNIKRAERLEQLMLKINETQRHHMIEVSEKIRDLFPQVTRIFSRICGLTNIA